MKSEDYIRSKIASPLSAQSSRLRTRLLSSSVAGVVIVHTGLLPTKIEGLGITFTQDQQQSFVAVLTIAVSYFLVNFTLTAIADFYVAKLARKAHVESELQQDGFLDGSFEEVSEKFNEVMLPLEVDSKTVHKIQTYRVIIDVALPIITALYAIVKLVCMLYKG